MLEANFGGGLSKLVVFIQHSFCTCKFLKFIPVCARVCASVFFSVGVFHLTYISHILPTMERKKTKKQQWLRLLKLVVGVSAEDMSTAAHHELNPTTARLPYCTPAICERVDLLPRSHCHI